MSQFDFDTEINREGTDSVKWEFHVHSGKAEYWVGPEEWLSG